MRKILMVVSVACLAVGCGDSISEEDTRVAWTSTNLALAQGSAQAQTAAQGVPAAPGGQNGGLAPRAAAQVDYDWACTEGGTAHFAGSAEAVVSQAGGSDVSFDLATDFNGCAVGGVTISGSLDYSAAVSADGAGAASTTFTMKGSLAYEGKVEGSCDIDMTAAVNVASGSVGASYEGSICGHNAKATLNVQG